VASANDAARRCVVARWGDYQVTGMMFTLKQTRFVEEYIVDLNGKQAAIRAGYSPKTAEMQASRLFRKAKVQTAVEEAMQARWKRTGITVDRVVLELAELAFSNILDFIEVHADGSVDIDLLRATRDRAVAIHDVVVRRRPEGSGNELGSVKLTRIKLCDKVKALDMLARHLGMFPISEVRSRRPKLSAR
jgi:phage terminase small subunit